jgi:hypothetical protein
MSSVDRSLRLACILVREAASQGRKAESWLDPNGNFHPILYSHFEWAAKRGKTMEEMAQDNWLRVTTGWKELMIENALYVPINGLQRQALIDLAIESKRYEKIVDYTGEREQVIWSIKDE